MTPPTTKRSPWQVYDLRGHSILLHGVPKIGKTTTAACFPRPKFFATHRGHAFLDAEVKKHVIQLSPGAEGWVEFKEHCQSGDEWPITYVVDFITDLYRMCRLYVCQQNNWTHVSDGQRGRGWDYLKDEFINGLQLLGQAAGPKRIIIFIDQTKHTELVLESMTLDKVEAAMPGSCAGIIVPICNYIWYLGYAGSNDDPATMMNQTTDEGQRSLWLRGTNLVMAGCNDGGVELSKIENFKKPGQFKQILMALARRTKKTNA